MGSASNDSWPAPNHLGFRFGRINNISVAGRPGLTYSAYGVMVPYWLLIPLAMYPPTRAVIRIRRELGRSRRGQCLACGYDRRATAPGGRCPECGVPPTSAARD